MSVLRRVKLRTPDGTESIEYPLGVEAKNVEVANQENLSQRLVRIDEDLEKNEEDIAAVGELAGTNKQNIGANEIRIDALERRSASVDKKPYYFDTIADMKAYQELKAGDMAITLGYYKPNDGRGSLWYIRTKTNEDVENFNTIFLNNNLVGIRINNYCGKTTGNMYGIADTATLSNINNTGIRAQIMGFHDESQLATYANRDHVIQYKEFRTKEPNLYVITNVSETSVTLNANPVNIEIGSIIDLYPDNNFVKTSKYSGFVSGIKNNIVYVNHWYLYGNTSDGQIPLNMVYACIDMPTKVWVNNDNLILTSGSNVKEGVIAEYGLVNEKGSSAKANGIDLVNLKGNNEFAYQARSNTTDLSSSDLLNYGFLAINIGTGLLVRNANRAMSVQNTSGQTLAYINGEGNYFNNNLGSSDIISMANNIFKMNANGVIQSISLKPKELSSGTINSSDAVFFILTGSATIKLDKGAIGRVCIIKSRSALNNVVINGNTYGLQKGKIVVLINNGSTWEDILGTLF